MASPDVVVLLSGPVSVGKTTLRDLLMSEQGFGAIRSSAYLRQVAAKQNGSSGRLDLQELGDAFRCRWSTSEPHSARPSSTCT